jgi:hypothetical protein
MARWPDLQRTVSGLQCAFYRTNLHVPFARADGLLELVTPEEEAAWQEKEQEQERRRLSLGGGSSGGGGELMAGGGGEGQEEDGSDNNGSGGKKKEEVVKPFGYYKGALYRTAAVKVRTARVPLMHRFPEELVDPKHDWVREEHRVMARGIGMFVYFVSCAPKTYPRLPPIPTHRTRLLTMMTS